MTLSLYLDEVTLFELVKSYIEGLNYIIDLDKFNIITLDTTNNRFIANKKEDNEELVIVFNIDINNNLVNISFRRNYINHDYITNISMKLKNNKFIKNTELKVYENDFKNYHRNLVFNNKKKEAFKVDNNYKLLDGYPKYSNKKRRIL